MDADSPTDTPIFDLRGVGYRQQATDILIDIDWRVRRGEHWAVLGPNGSGKTSLLRVACGYRWHTSGELRRFGEELIDLSELRSRIGWVSADLLGRVCPGDWAVATVVSGRFGQLGLRAVGERRPGNQDFADAASLLDSMGAGAIAEKPLRVLSQGERQQVLVARARMTDPLLLVLDEPCAGMDPGARERFLDWLGQLMAEPTTPAVAMITHHVEEVLPQFEQTLLIGEGRIVAAGPTAEVVTAGSLSKTYGVGVARLEEHVGRRWPIWDRSESTSR